MAARWGGGSDDAAPGAAVPAVARRSGGSGGTAKKAVEGKSKSGSWSALQHVGQMRYGSFVSNKIGFGSFDHAVLTTTPLRMY